RALQGRDRLGAAHPDRRAPLVRLVAVAQLVAQPFREAPAPAAAAVGVLLLVDDGIDRGVRRVGQELRLGPLPDVAGHVAQAEPAGRERPDRAAAERVVVAAVLLGRILFAPREAAVVLPALGGVLPLALARQALAGPGAIRGGLAQIDAVDRVVAAISLE